MKCLFCSKPLAKRGMCDAHYNRYNRGTFVPSDEPPVAKKTKQHRRLTLTGSAYHMASPAMGNQGPFRRYEYGGDTPVPA